MPSHLKPDQERPPGVSELDVKGNNYADIEAGKAAKWFGLSLHINAPVLYFMHLVKRIHKRLACIIISLPDRKKLESIKVVKPSPEPLDELIVRSPHSAFWPGGSDRVHCARCHSSFHDKDLNLRTWPAHHARTSGP